MSYQFANQPLAPVNQQSSFGLSPNVAALVSYISVPLTSILVLATEKENRFVRFHAWQSIFLGVTFFVAAIILGAAMGVIGGIAAMIEPTLGIIVMMLALVLWIALAATVALAWILCLVKAYRGVMYHLPFAGRFAEKMSK